jgi:hypothetical protein
MNRSAFLIMAAAFGTFAADTLKFAGRPTLSVILVIASFASLELLNVHI